VSIDLDLQIAGEFPAVPSAERFRSWVTVVLQGKAPVELTVRVVDTDESQALNRTYRGKDRATNVLSFAADLPEGIDLPLLGDIVICAPVVEREAAEQGKDLEHHWAHLTVHGVLHLLGHDHQNDDDAQEMEAIEIRVLADLGIPNPYT
jgi:probable rRNA maturation factor